MNRLAQKMSVAMIASIALAGCAGPNQAGSAKMTADALSPTELAAYAARTPYPQTSPGNELRAAAIVSGDRSALKIYNFSNEPFAEVDVWVNGAWLQHVRGIGANGSVIVKTSDLYNAFGKNFSGQSEPMTKVQIRIGDRFYNAMGPVSE